MYPDAGDPKNLTYVLWKHGLDSDMNLDAALGTMVHDVKSENLVLGLNSQQLQARFGYVRSYDQVGPYLQLCVTTPAVGEPSRHEVLYLRGGPYMVIMKDGRATDLVLCKGY